MPVPTRVHRTKMPKWLSIAYMHLWNKCVHYVRIELLALLKHDMSTCPPVCYNSLIACVCVCLTGQTLMRKSDPRDCVCVCVWVCICILVWKYWVKTEKLGSFSCTHASVLMFTHRQLWPTALPEWWHMHPPPCWLQLLLPTWLWGKPVWER